MLSLYGQVGPAVGADGSPLPIRLSKDAAVVQQNLHAAYYEQAARGNVFGASNQAAQAVSVALATTYTGLCLSNPLNSGVNLSVISAGLALTVAPAAIASIHLIGGSSPSTNVTHTTPVTPVSMLLGSSKSPIAKADAAATIPTPVYLMSLMGGFTAAALPTSPNVVFDLQGQLVLAPGGFVCIGALTAVTGFGHFVWEEVAI